MQNWFAIETEAEFRRQEWTAATAANAKAAMAQGDRAKRSWVRLPAIALAQLKQQLRVWPGRALTKPLDTGHCTVCSVAAGD